MQPETMTAPRGWDGPRPRLFAVIGPMVLLVIQVAGTLGASHTQTEATDLGPLAIALVVVGPLALLRVTRAPRAVLAFIAVITALYLSLGYPYGPVFASFVAAAVVNTAVGNRREAWSATALLLTAAIVLQATVREESLSWGWAAGVTAWAAIVVVVGELIRSRRASFAEARRARSEAARRQAGEERLRIARELHDVVAHHMSLINVQAGVALHLVDRKPEQVEAALSTIKEASKEALTELRSLIGVLRAEGEDAPRTPVATLQALDNLVVRARHAGIEVSVDVRGDARALPQAVDFAAYRIIQEALTNVVRHSGATSAHIDIDVGAAALTLIVQDSGRGARAHHAEAGSGILGMTERAEALGGTLNVSPASPSGTRVEARLPIGAAR